MTLSLGACTHLAAGWRGHAGRTPRDLPPPVRVEKCEGRGKFEGDFEGRLRAAPPGRHFEALVDLTDQLDLDRLGAMLRRQGRSKTARRQAVIGALESVAARQQALIQPVLDKLVAQGRLTYVRRVAIVNRLLVEGTAGGILELATLPEVARVMPEWTSARRAGRAVVPPSPGPDQPGTSLGESFESWAIEAIGADRLWGIGFDGRGVTVAMIDTGVYGAHEQLRGRGLEGSRGWYDPIEGAPEPYDNHGHGTSVLSQAVGGGSAGRVLGVAPAARWAVALANWHNQYSRMRMTLAADWVLRVARPDVLLNAWSHDEGSCTAFDLGFINAWKAAEIFVVFPAGNGGPAAGTGESPADLTGTYPWGGPVLSIGAIDLGGEAAAISSRGPSACGSPAFPGLAAPGAALPFAFPSGPEGYGVGEGTSLAVGIVGGAAALLLQAAPELSPADLEAILLATARDVGPAGRDDVTGAGVLDLPAALERIRAESRTRTQPRGSEGPGGRREAEGRRGQPRRRGP